MSTIEYWIQLENHPWDIAPHNIDRMDGLDMEHKRNGTPPVYARLTSPSTPKVVRNRRMYRPLSTEALILRRYTENWAQPDDRKVNPWDQNEPDPTDHGTMGTIPGPVIECNVGDTVIVHFRNWDFRLTPPPPTTPILMDIRSRTHSLHPHGFVFSPKSDGAYPLSPPDNSQRVGPEHPLWATTLGSDDESTPKKGDRVPPGGTFTYTWNTNGWPTTAGVWLYHDHSICDTHNVQLGAIGIIVIHNSEAHDPDEVVIQDLPGDSFIGSPTFQVCTDFAKSIPIMPHDLNLLGLDAHPENESPMITMSEDEQAMSGKAHKLSSHKHLSKGRSVEQLKINRGDIVFQVDRDLRNVTGFCNSFYRSPPAKAQYLLLFHNLGDGGSCINGRKYLGNTPTLIAGESTKMRFGLIGMGNTDGFHTFHLHGHRWVIPGPDGNIKTDANSIQNSAQVRAVSQFEDTHTFGPANSFVFTIHEDSFMGAQPGEKAGEYHMHCHVLTHMMDGMMGSLLVIPNDGAIAAGLPSGEECPDDQDMSGMGGMDGVGTTGNTHTVHLTRNDSPPDHFPSFNPGRISIAVGDTVTWVWDESAEHSITSDTGIWDSGRQTGGSYSHVFSNPGSFQYYCIVHGGPGGSGMSGTVTVNPP